MHESFTADFSGRTVSCPYCGSNKTELLSLFGQQLLMLQYYCNTCHTPFEHVKDDNVRDEQAETGVADQSSAR